MKMRNRFVKQVLFLFSLLQQSLTCSSFQINQPSSSTALFTSQSVISNKETEASIFLRDRATDITENHLYPQHEYTERVIAGGKAQGIDPGTIVSASDARNSLTYGEFPLKSFDILVDLATKIWSEQNDVHEEKGAHTMIDLGSGCGRLVLYAGLSRARWNIHGIEISNILHCFAEDSLKRGYQKKFFEVNTVIRKGDNILASQNNIDNVKESNMTATSLSKSYVKFHLGPADEQEHILKKADLIFAYSTVWETKGFSNEVGGMVLDDSWSKLLANSCSPGCVVVTTDRLLDPTYGWVLKEKVEVENDDLAGSVGYISVLCPGL